MKNTRSTLNLRTNEDYAAPAYDPVIMLYINVLEKALHDLRNGNAIIKMKTVEWFQSDRSGLTNSKVFISFTDILDNVPLSKSRMDYIEALLAEYHLSTITR